MALTKEQIADIKRRKMERMKKSKKPLTKQAGSTLKQKLSGEIRVYKSDMDTMRKTLSKMSTGGFFSLSHNGEGVVRVMPAWKQGGVFYKELRRHWVSTPNGQRGVLCAEDDEGNRLFGYPCFLCAKVRKLIDSGNEDNTKLADKIKAGTRYAMNIVDMTDEENPKPGLIWESPKTPVIEIIKLINDEKYYGDCTDPITGYNLRVSREDVGNAPTKYKVKPVMKRGKIKRSLMEKSMKDLDKFFKHPTKDELKAFADAIVIGYSDDEYDDDEDDD
jgi:hypothetical protein